MGEGPARAPGHCRGAGHPPSAEHASSEHRGEEPGRIRPRRFAPASNRPWRDPADRPFEGAPGSSGPSGSIERFDRSGDPAPDARRDAAHHGARPGVDRRDLGDSSVFGGGRGARADPSDRRDHHAVRCHRATCVRASGRPRRPSQPVGRVWNGLRAVEAGPALRRSGRRSQSLNRWDLVMSRILAGLDVGSSKTAVVIAEVSLDGDQTRVKVLGVGQARTTGIRHEVVTDLEATTESIRRAVKEAELMSGVTIESLYVGIAGEHMHGRASTGVVAVGGKEIGIRDVERVNEVARAIVVPADREVLHAI
ncbi:MAG: hypothetical protein GEU90_17270, partial [Gemmatimonas sp.]|nr:hypothetical protein [Gemmatimonas sp.]